MWLCSGYQKTFTSSLINLSEDKHEGPLSLTFLASPPQGLKDLEHPMGHQWVLLEFYFPFLLPKQRQ